MFMLLNTGIVVRLSNKNNYILVESKNKENLFSNYSLMSP